MGEMTIGLPKENLEGLTVGMPMLCVSRDKEFKGTIIKIEERGETVYATIEGDFVIQAPRSRYSLAGEEGDG